jgi:hypothetical protein
MHKVTKEQMDKVFSCNETGEDHSVVFDLLDLNPYDKYDESYELDFVCVLREYKFEWLLDEVIAYPENYFSEGDELIMRILTSKKSTEDDVAYLREYFIQVEEEEESPEYMIVSEMSDDSGLSAFVVYIEQMWGQGGLYVNEFIGFYKTAEEAEIASQNVDGASLA